ncbi:Bardet-Biedl syndrome 1 protein like protein (BBS1-like protein 1), partial [Strigomonas culicis]
MSKSTDPDKMWLFAFKDSLANLSAFSNCVTTVDVLGDGESRLLVADGSKKIKQFSGTSLQTEVPLITVPSAIASFYAESANAFKRPIVAVATGPYIFMYRNNKPLYRFSVPVIPIEVDEQDVWRNLMEGNISLEDAVELFGQKVDSGGNVCTRTIDLLLLDSHEERQAFLADLHGKPLRQHDLVTCMGTLLRDSPDPAGKGLLCFCTENRLLYVLRNTATEVERVVELPSVGVELICAGFYRGEYRIIISCRDGRIYSLKNGVLHSSVIQPDAQPSSITRYDNFIVVATTANTVTSFNLKGKKQHTLYMPCPVTNLATLTDAVAGTAKALLVALSNGELRVYVGKHLQYTMQLHDTVSALYFGRYGREDSALLIVLKTGALLVYLLHRKAVFSQQKDLETRPPPEQDIPIAVPKLSSVFSLQTEREKKYGLDMYKTFQYDLCVLRLHVAK